jgi:WD40 repeat protein
MNVIYRLLATLAFVGSAGWLQVGLAQEQDRAAHRSYLAHLAAANASLRLNEAGEAKRWLAACPGARDSWEWRYLHGQSDSSLQTFDTGNWTPIKVAYSKDGSQLAVACDDGCVRILNAANFSLIAEMKIGTQAVYAARFDPTGKRIATCNRDGKIAVWEIATGKQLWEQTSGGQGLADVAFHPDGSALAFSSWFRGSTSVKGLVSLWNAETGEQSWKTEFGVKPIVVIKFSPDGSRFAVGTWDALVGVWNSKDPSSEPQEFNFHDVANYSAIDDIDFDSAGDRIVAASKNATPRVWNLKTNDIEKDLRGHANAVFAVAFAEQGKFLISGGSDGVASVWDTTAGRISHRFMGHENRITSLAVSPNDEHLVTCSPDKTIRKWPLHSRAHFQDSQSSKSVYGVALSGDKKLLATGGQNPSVVTIWDYAAKRPLRQLSELSGSVNYLDFGPDHKLVGGNWSSEMVVWNAMTGEVLLKLHKDPKFGGIQQCSYSPDGRLIAASVRNKLAVVWDAKSGEIVTSFPMEDNCWGIRFSPDSQSLAVGNGKGVLRVFACDTWKETYQADGNAQLIYGLKFSADGKKIACGSENGNLVLHDLASKKKAVVPGAHSERIWSVDFLSDGSRLVTGGADLKLKFWDPVSAETVLTLSGFPEPIYNIVPAQNSDEIVIGSMVQLELIQPKAKK